MPINLSCRLGQPDTARILEPSNPCSLVMTSSSCEECPTSSTITRIFHRNPRQQQHILRLQILTALSSFCNLYREAYVAARRGEESLIWQRHQLAWSPFRLSHGRANFRALS